MTMVQPADSAKLRAWLHEPITPIGEGHVYLHYKGGLYRIICLARNEADPEELRVIYKSLKFGYVWDRTFQNFNEPVRWPDGEMRARFVPKPKQLPAKT
jgi:hypothetical protein